MFHNLQADLELLARRVTLLEAIIWPGNAETSSPTAPLAPLQTLTLELLSVGLVTDVDAL